VVVLAAAAATNLSAAQAGVLNKHDPAFRRLDIDVQMLSEMGLFFGRKFRACILWSIYRMTNDPNAKTEALNMYNSAKMAWTKLATIGSVYKKLNYGSTHGHWSDRTAAITDDINAMNGITYTTTSSITTHPGAAPAAIAAAKGRPTRPVSGAMHSQPNKFTPGTALPVALTADASTTAVKLYYRHVNQSETWQSMAMTKSGTTFSASIPGSYTQTIYPLEYYFALAKGNNSGVLFPGFDSTLANQPYFVVRSVNPTSAN